MAADTGSAPPRSSPCSRVIQKHTSMEAGGRMLLLLEEEEIGRLADWQIDGTQQPLFLIIRSRCCSTQYCTEYLLREK